MPRPVPEGSALPQPEFEAARSRTAFARGFALSRARRYSTGSLFAVDASSSMKLSTTNTLCVGPTPRQNAVRIPGGSCRTRSEEHTSELQSRLHLVCRLLLEKK